ncbi:MAG: general secretion pathway protein GspK [Burkholderiales bacterium]|nr:general secretion pathway protein GspK [Burkholderiales bacterium]
MTPTACRERGIALVIVLWLTIMLTVIAGGFAFAMRNEAVAARNALALAQAREAADGAIDRTAFELSRPRFATAWGSDGQAHAWREGDVSIVASAVDESARIDLNAASEALLRGLFENVGGVDREAATRIVDAIQDWKDADDLRRPNGAEEADYRSAGRTYKPANTPFETVSELARVLGVTPTVYARVVGSLTVQSRQPGINSALAPREVLLAIPNVTPEQVDAFLAQRSEALAAKLPAPAFAPALAFVAGAVPVWRIHAVATTPDGVTFARDAVVRPSGDPRRPLLTLVWQEGSTEGVPPLAASAPSTTPAGPTPGTK